MRSLPLYPEDRRTAIERVRPIADRDPDCRRCALHAGPKNVCLPPGSLARPEIDKPALLVVVPWPTVAEDASGLALSNDVGRWLRGVVGSLWEGPICYTHAVRCSPAKAGKDDIPDAAIPACRPYLAGVMADVKPARILMVGATAGRAILDRGPHPQWVRGGYAYLANGVPAYWMPEPTDAAINSLYGRDWREDAQRALCEPLPPEPKWGAVTHRIETPEDARQAVHDLRAHGSVSYDVEHSGGLYTEYFEVDCLGIAKTGTFESYVWGVRALNNPECVAPLRELLEDPEIEVVAQNAKVEFQSCQFDRRMKFSPRDRVVDTLVVRKVGHPDVNAPLEISAELVGMGGHKEAMDREVAQMVQVVNATRAEHDVGEQHLPGTIDRCLEAALVYRGLDPEAVAYGMVGEDRRDTYVALDAVTTGLLVPVIRKDIQAPGLLRVCDEMERVPRAVSHLERSGILVDRNQIHMVADYVEQEIEKVARHLAADGLTEPSKPESVCAYLYDHHGLPIGGVSRKTGKPSVDKNALARLPQDHQAVKLYSAWKTLETVRTRYSRNLLDFIRADGRIHAHYNANGTETGRWSSSDPNNQNQPSRGQLAKMVKRIFIAPRGRVLISADFSQLEYRIAALLSGDKNWTKAFQDGKDLHRQNAELASFAWGIDRAVAEAMSEEEIAPYRYKAKAVGFGLLYGKVVFSLAREWGVPEEDAQAVVDAIMGNSPELAAWIQEMHRFAYANGYVNTYMDGQPARWRPLYGIRSPIPKDVSSAKRQAVNSPVQGSAADYMMRSLVEVVDWLEGDRLPACLVGTVHDSMMVECDEQLAPDVARGMLDIMESWWCGDVPLKADLEIGRTWGTLMKARMEGGTIMVKAGDLWVPYDVALA